MATLADVIRKRRQSGQSVSGSLMGSLKEKFKEKIDPRRIFNQDGILTALFPSLKAFKATGTKDTGSKLQRKSVELSSSTSPSNINFSLIEKNTEITAKNTMVLPGLARDMNIMRQNMAKLLKSFGVKPTYKADAFFKRSREREAAYESKVKSLKEDGKPVEKENEDKKSFLTKILGFAMSLKDSIGGLLTGTLGFLQTTITAIMNPISTIVRLAFISLTTLVTKLIGKILVSVFKIFTKVTFLDVLGKLLLSPEGKGILAAAMAAVAVTYGLHSLRKDFQMSEIEDYRNRGMEYLEEKIPTGIFSPGKISWEEAEQYAVAGELMKKDPSLTDPNEAIQKAKEIIRGVEFMLEDPEAQMSSSSAESMSNAQPMEQSDENVKLVYGKKLEIQQAIVNVLEKKVKENPDNQSIKNDLYDAQTQLLIMKQEFGPTLGLTNPAKGQVTPAESNNTQGSSLKEQTEQNKQAMNSYLGDDGVSGIYPISENNNTNIASNDGPIPTVVDTEYIGHIFGNRESMYV